MKKTMLMLFTMSVLAFATPVSVTFLGSSTQANNGSFYVGPYNLTVDGAPVLGTCVNWDLEVGPPYSWEANELPLPNTQQFLSAVWLTEQFIGYPDWVSIHQAIWDEFGASYSDPTTLGWLAQANNPANYGSVDASNFLL